MNNIEKKLDALIDALGFDVEEVLEQAIPSGQIIIAHDYKLTKRKYNEKPTIHKIVRIYEKGEISSGEMIARINEQVWEEQ